MPHSCRYSGKVLKRISHVRSADDCRSFCKAIQVGLLATVIRACALGQFVEAIGDASRTDQ